METVREFCFVTEVFTQRSTQKAPSAKAAPATIKAPATDDDLKAAFDELLAAITPAEQQTVIAELRKPRGASALGTRQLVDTPEARAAARAMFGL